MEETSQTAAEEDRQTNGTCTEHNEKEMYLSDIQPAHCALKGFESKTCSIQQSTLIRDASQFLFSTSSSNEWHWWVVIRTAAWFSFSFKICAHIKTCFLDRTCVLKFKHISKLKCIFVSVCSLLTPCCDFSRISGYDLLVRHPTTMRSHFIYFINGCRNGRSMVAGGQKSYLKNIQMQKQIQGKSSKAL